MFDDVQPSFDWSGLARDGLRILAQTISDRSIPDYGPMPQPTYSMQPAAWPSVAGAGAAGARSLLQMLGGGAVAAAGTAVVRAGGKLLTAAGTWVSRKKAVQLAKVLGIQGAATALGIGAVELAEAVLADRNKAGRGKGISAAQLRTTRRTMRTVERMHRQIQGYCRDAGIRSKTKTVFVGGKKCR